MRPFALLATLFCLSAGAEQIEWGDYIVRSSPAGPVVTSEPFGVWQGYVAHLRPVLEPVNRHQLQFEFITEDYFAPENSGHFAIAVMAHAPGDQLIGHGVVIGNVAAYGIHPGGCVQTPSPNRVAIESFWAGGNCVWGEISSSEPLQNGTRYRLTISAQKTAAGEPGRLVSYTLERKASRYWYKTTERTLFDTSPVPENYAGWFILEVFSTHEWTVHIENVVETIE